ncbi:MAG: discoidin domain-containing protein [Desulfomonile tiedjei]|nr:discoidin domain-containing protein [Desulfomonile tiedjei]
MEEKTAEQNKTASAAARRKTSIPGKVWRILRRVVKASLYALYLLVVVVLLLWGVEALAKYAVSRTFLGSVYHDRIGMALQDRTRPVPHYDYDFVPRVCVEYNSLKGNQYEYANNAGFREFTDVVIPKPADEFRIFLTGGSTAFGLGAVGEATGPMKWYALEYRETISHMMEQILNASAPLPGKKIKVYNTAVWGYAYQHHLMRYLAKLRQYEPDMVISLDGANEIPLVSKIEEDWNYFREGQYNGILRQIFSYKLPGLASYLTLWFKNNTYLMTYIWSEKDVLTELNRDILMEVEPSAMARTEANAGAGAMSPERASSLMDRNVATVVRVVENYHSMLENDGVPHIIAVQPWFYLSRKPLHEKEKIVAELKGQKDYGGVPSDKAYKLLIDRMVESAGRKGYFLVDFSEYFDDVSEWVFTDWCHLTSGANYLIAKELSNLVKERFFQKPLGPGDQIEDKNGLFSDLATSAAVVSAPDGDSDSAALRDILGGHPGRQVFSTKPVPPDEKLEVVLDLGAAVPLSRLRMVWADEASVPDEWIVEASLDGETWQPFVEADKDRIDSYSQWPGFEYYAGEPVKARYVKYRPVKTEERTIRLRLWSMFR